MSEISFIQVVRCSIATAIWWIEDITAPVWKRIWSNKPQQTCHVCNWIPIALSNPRFIRLSRAEFLKQAPGNVNDRVFTLTILSNIVFFVFYLSFNMLYVIV